MFENKKIAGAGGGKAGGQPRAAVESEDSLRSKSFARIVDVLSEGEIVGLTNGFKSIFLDDTPVQNADGSFNFQNVSFIERFGTQGQTHVQGFPSSEAANGSVNGIEVLNGAPGPVTRSITNPSANYALVTIGVPSLFHQNTENGDINGTSVEYQIALQVDGGGFSNQVSRSQWVLGSGGGTQLVTAGPTTKFRGTVKWTPPAQQNGSVTYRVAAVVQYRVQGSGSAWTKIMDVGTAAAPFEQWGGAFGAREHTFPFEIENLSNSTWEIQIIASQVDGTIVFDSIEYETTAASSIISGKTTTRYQRTHRIELPPGTLREIRVTRVTADAPNSALANKTYWDILIEGVDQKLTFPNSAYVGISIDAQQFSSIPRRGYLVKGLMVKIPSNYNPVTRVYTGNWDGTFTTAWTNNPAWCWYDIVTNSRYGLGQFIDAEKVDKWTLFQIGQYCDELVPDGFGGTEPRFTCNAYIQTQEEAYTVIQTMAAIFRGMVYWAGGQLVPTQDSPGSAMHVFTQANVREGMFNYGSSSKKSRHTVALVQWNDPNDHYRQKVEYVEDVEGINKYGISEITIPAIGATSRGQAHRAGNWLLYTERMETETCTFQTALEGFSVRPGNLVKIADSFRAGKRYGGRIVEAAATPPTITLDQPLVIEPAKSYTVDVKLPDGTVANSIITNVPGTYTVLTLNTQFSPQPEKHANYIITVSDLSPQLFRVISVSVKDEVWVEVICLESNQSKYAAVETGLKLDVLPISLLTVIPLPPTDMELTDFIRVQGTGDLVTILSASWKPPAGAASLVTSYLIEYRRESGNWVTAPHSTMAATSVEIPNVHDGERYYVRVSSINSGGLKSNNALEGSRVILGKKAPPADVTNFIHTNQLNGLFFTWDEVPDFDIDIYEIRTGATWASGTMVYTGRATNYLHRFLPAATTNFYIKALDTSGNYSTTETLRAVTIGGPNAPGAFTHVFAGPDVVFTWNQPTSPQPINEYEIRHGATYDGGTNVGRVKGNSFKIKVDWQGPRTFWVVAYDTADNKGATTAFTTVNPTTYNAPVVGSEIIAVKLQLSWDTPAGGSLPIEYFDIRHGASWALGSPVATISGNNYRVPITWTGDRTFWVAAVDSAGNPGTAGSRVGTVNAPSAPAVTSQVASINAILSWTAPSASLPIAEYEIRYGDDPVFLNNTLLGRVKGTTITTKVNWLGERKFLVAGVDENGNVGAAGQTSVTIVKPSAPEVTVEVIDNNVLLKWGDTAQTLPIDRYEIRKGAVFSSAEVVGTVSARFSLIFETAQGTYTYWIVGIDSAGNYGDETPLTATVNQPPDFVLFNDYAAHPLFVGTKTNAWVEPETGTLIVNVNTTETIEQHFDTRGWTLIQDQIDDGYPLVLVGKTTGAYEEERDYGITVPSTKITMTTGYDQISGTTTRFPTLRISPDDVEYTEFPGISTVFASAFRYVQFRQDFTATHDGTGLGDDTSMLLRLDSLKFVLDLKLKTFQGEKEIIYTDADVAFTRSDATATRVNELGLIESVAANAPRFDYNPVTKLCRGLLLEGARTNDALHSADMSNAFYNSSAVVTTNTHVAPDGTTTADTVNDDNAAGWEALSTTAITFSGAPAGNCCVSIYVRKDAIAPSTRFGLLRLLFLNSSDALQGYIDHRFATNTGAFTTVEDANGSNNLASSGVQNCGDYWRVYVAGSSNSGTTAKYKFEFYPAVGAHATLATYDPNITGSMIVWGAQLEQGAFPTSYIPTTSAAVTRNSDAAIINAINQFYNAAEGTLFVEAQANEAAISANQYVAQFDDGGNNERILIYRAAATPTMFVADGGVTQVQTVTTATTNGAVFKMAFGFKLNDFAASLNGATVVTDNSGTMPTVDRLRFGSNTGIAEHLNGHLRQVIYWSTRLTNAELQLIASGQMVEDEEIGWDFTEGNSLEPDGQIIDVSSAEFLDIQSIAVDPQSVRPQYAAFIFHDIPSPKFFSVFLYDQDGNRISGNVTYVIRGV